MGDGSRSRCRAEGSPSPRCSPTHCSFRSTDHPPPRSAACPTHCSQPPQTPPGSCSRSRSGLADRPSSTHEPREWTIAVGDHTPVRSPHTPHCPPPRRSAPVAHPHESDACSDLPPDTDNSGHHRRPPQDRVARIVCPPIRDDALKDAVRDDAEPPIPTDRSPGISHARVPPSIRNPFSVDHDPNNGLCIAHHRSLSHRNPDPCPDLRNTTGRKKSENLAPFDPRVHGQSHGANTRRRSDYNDHS